MAITGEVLPASRDYQGIGMMAGQWSRQIHAKTAAALEKVMPPPAKVLDVGAGHGAFSRRLANAGYEVVAIEKEVEFNPDDITCIRSDLNEKWPSGMGEPFDAVTAVEILEHLENPFHFLREAKRILRRDIHGVVAISTPNELNLTERLDFFINGRVRMLAHDDHRTVIFPQTLTRMCKECGFKIISHGTDIDTIRMSTSPIKRNAKLMLWFFSRLIVRNDIYSRGGSNIWILENHI